MTNAPIDRPASAAGRRDLPDAPMLAAANGREPSRRPVWFMRQAGRSLPEYRELRVGTGMLDSCFTPDLVTEITMQPVRRHDVDAAILFSDIVVPLKAAGVDLDIVAGTGPVIANPIRTSDDVLALPRLDAEQVAPVADAVRLLTSELGQTPLIGFAGAPFTLASYLIEGGPSRNHEHTKALMHSDRAAWHELMGRLADNTITFLQAQVDAGVDAIQVFDSWAGTLSAVDYREFIKPHTERVLAEMADAGVPRIHFGVGTGELLPDMADVGVEVIGIDWRVPLDTAVERVGPGLVLQGNLDPAVLFADWDTIETEATRVMAEADRALEAGATGHIFNLGHGVLPATNPEMITRLVSLIHES